jgi:glycosyltransferase involved in cell wall biosynthesis
MSVEVAVNLLWCVPGDVGGSEEYLVRQLLGLAEVAPQWRAVAYAPAGFAKAHPELAAVGEIREASIDGASRARRIATEATWLRRKAQGAALRHHGGGTAPTGATRPYVLTIHDLQYRTFPEHFGRVKRAYFEAAMPRSARQAAAVAVPTEYVRGTVIDAYDVDPLGVVVVPHGVEPALVTEVAPADELRRRYALGDGPIVVYPAVTNPHKNHAFLLELLRTRWTEPDLRLVLIGGVGGAEPLVTACTDRRVCRLGRVPNADRNGLLATADALVFPSRYEGFGAPLIESMTLGTPVVAADAACIPEVVGDAGLVLPLDVDAWAGALDEVRERRAELVDRGRARADRFTAARSGAALAGAYTVALERA